MIGGGGGGGGGGEKGKGSEGGCYQITKGTTLDCGHNRHCTPFQINIPVATILHTGQADL